MDKVKSTATQTEEAVSRLERFRAISFGMFIFKRYTSGQIAPLTAAFAYFWIFAIPPLILLIVMLGAALNALTDAQVVEELQRLITEHAPPELQQFLNQVVDRGVAQMSGGFASIGVLITAVVALWSASSAVGILLVGFNRAYAVEETRSYIHKRGLLILLTVALVIFINVAFILLIFGERLGNWLSDFFDLDPQFLDFWNTARWPFALICLSLIIAGLYWSGPNVHQRFRHVLYGTAFATLGVVAIFFGVGLYIQFANPESAYGVVGGIVLMLLLLKFAGMVFFLGAIINSVNLERSGDRLDKFLDGPEMVVANQ